MANKQVVAFGPFKDFIADGVRMGDTIHLSGSVSVDEKGQALVAKGGSDHHRGHHERGLRPLLGEYA